jgi:hypothetical protein
MEAPGWRCDVHGIIRNVRFLPAWGSVEPSKTNIQLSTPPLYIVNLKKMEMKEKTYPNSKRARCAVCNCFFGQDSERRQARIYTNTWRLRGALRQIEFKL